MSKRTIEVDQDYKVTKSGAHRGVGWQVAAFRFEDKPSPYSSGTAWATYVFLSEEMHEKVKGRVDDAPFHCGQTYYRRLREEHAEHINSENKPDWIVRSEKPYYKIGDDFQHLYDEERTQSFEGLERHVKRVIDYLLDGEKE